MTVDQSQDRKINLIIGALMAIGGLASILLYIDQQKTAKIQEEIMQLDKELKELQLNKLRNNA